ncbi:MAG: nucleoid-associated protein [Meiothermus sp.]|nr:nucleoid-associated protein [Meiothermus sp.]
MSTFRDIQIKRLIAHEVFARTSGTGNEDKSPTFSNDITQLHGKAKAVLEELLSKALAKNRFCLQVSVVKTEKDSTFQLAAQCLDAQKSDDFIQLSRDITRALWEAQNTARIPGGTVVIATGEIGNPKKRFICIVKAEPHGGFTKSNNNGVFDLDYVAELLMTEAQHLHKVAIFIENHVGSYSVGERTPSDFDVYAYDANMAYQNAGIHTTYFVKTFLGSSIADTDQVLTKTFYDIASEQIDKLNLGDEQKVDLSNALHAYLMTSNSNAISPTDYATQYLPTAEVQDKFITAFKDAKFPANGVHKDTSLIAHQLKKRNLEFTTRIKISGPSEQFGTLVKIEETTEDYILVKVYGKLKES